MLRIFVENINPKPKKRPRVYRWSTVNPSEEDEKTLRDLIASHDECPKKPLNQQIRVAIKFGITPPKSSPKWKLQLMEEEKIRPNKSPDLDNYVKLVLDSLNELIWEDDRYIVEIHSALYYSQIPYIDLYVDEFNSPRLMKDKDNIVINDYPEFFR